MRVAFIIHNQADTGPYFKVLEQCAALVRNGASVTLFCTSPSRRVGIDESVRDGVHVVEFPDLLVGSLRQGVDLWNALHRIFYAESRQFDVIHAVDCRPNVIIPALILKKRQRIPLVLSWWDLFGGGGLASERSGRLYAVTAGAVETWFEEYFRRFADGATTITAFLQERLVSMGYPRERTMVQHVGCDASLPLIDKAVVRQQLGFVPEQPVLSFVGTIYHTDFSFLLEALDILKQRTDYKLVWIGSFSIAPEVCRAYNIHHTGKLKTTAEVASWLAASDLCLLPMRPNITNRARWHSKVSDYWNVGRPVVSTPVSDFPEIFQHEDVGWLAGGDTPGDFADALLLALQERDAWERKGRAAKLYVQRELDVGVLARRLMNFYQQCKRSWLSGAPRS